MNICFLMKYFRIGGISIVTSVLAQKFIENGHNVIVVTFNEPEFDMGKRLKPSVPIYALDGLHYSKTNITTLRNALERHRIHIVINQWGLPFLPILVLKRASRNMNIKIISVYHITPNANNRLKKIEYLKANNKNPFSKLVLSGLLFVFRLVTGLSMRYVYQQSDVYLLLSQSYLPIFKKFIFASDVPKVYILPNPVTIDCSDYQCATVKEKEILYVGRLERFAKRVDRLIETWALLEKEYPDWRLTIVGDGPDKRRLQMQANKLGLKQIYFEGYRHPKPYYERASILMLTSEFEGFPLVLMECMSFGVIPVVYGSFSSVYDIIQDNIDGIIIPYTLKKYSSVKAADSLRGIMDNRDCRNKMSQTVLQTSKYYSLDYIGKMWENLFMSE